MKYIKITSDGHIDINAFILMGASSKRQDSSKIGQWGSGLKYSIAFLLRHKIEFYVFSGLGRIDFATAPVNFRDQDFEIIQVNGRATSMTTEMGFDWENWFVLREIYCNALDEGAAAIKVVEESFCAEEGKTIFYIAINDEFQKIIDNWNQYFSEDRKDISYYDPEDLSALYAGGENTLVYRKGIRCHFVPTERAIFHYDMPWVSLNESRVIKSSWDFNWALSRFLRKCTSRKVIHQIYAMINECWESELRWDQSSSEYSEAWLEEIGSRVLVPKENAGFWLDEMKYVSPLILPNSMIMGLKERFGDAIKIIGESSEGSGRGDVKIIETLTAKQSYLMKEALRFLEEAKYEVKYDIKVCQFQRKDQLGGIDKKTILLSERLFDTGRKEIVSVIIEEQEHLITGYSDESRALQSHLFRMIVSQMEEKTGFFL